MRIRALTVFNQTLQLRFFFSIFIITFPASLFDNTVRKLNILVPFKIVGVKEA